MEFLNPAGIYYEMFQLIVRFLIRICAGLRILINKLILIFGDISLENYHSAGSEDKG